MSQNDSPAVQASIENFWDNYLFILEKNTIPAKSRPWYRKHVEAYIKANNNIPLNTHTGQHIDRYLNAKGRLPQLKEWQFRQIVDALRLLFSELIRTQWSTSYYWFQ